MITNLRHRGKKILERIETIATMPTKEQEQLFNVIDALIRDYKTKQAYSS
ncbi:hypothetical protein [Flavobacterium columnare]|nr:hypothetical protein [Flavobacterium columnare]ANO47193.1 hypothetical protein Pf1_01736 [Flavobacterium columnare]ANO47194.1 hypothetical protein Pf1_01737 [Flavobacterium columnare]ANO47202.1 hypothetical protein Pf1_01745 [Flavobacterium columnare]